MEGRRHAQAKSKFTLKLKSNIPPTLSLPYLRWRENPSLSNEQLLIEDYLREWENVLRLKMTIKVRQITSLKISKLITYCCFWFGQWFSLFLRWMFLYQHHTELRVFAKDKIASLIKYNSCQTFILEECFLRRFIFCLELIFTQANEVPIGILQSRFELLLKVYLLSCPVISHQQWILIFNLFGRDID